MSRATLSALLAMLLACGALAAARWGSVAWQQVAAPARSPQDAKKPRYAVQVGSYENRIEADDVALKIASTTKLPALVQPATVHDRKFFRVRVYATSHAEARRLAAHLRRAGFSTWIVPLP